MKNQSIITLIAVAALAGILITAAAVSQDALAKCKKKYRGGHDSKSSQTIAQTNFCGNGNLAMKISCQNLASQIHGSGNAVNVIGL
ncbi:MAG TPA: hypothetical protein VH500_19485 [Nitrososphaeraceae archaeon]|jgi:hypothetical protein